jgi:hypothetical protein
MRKTKPLSPHKARKIPGRPAKPAERPAPPTADELLGRIGEVLGKVDALMEKRKSTMPWNFPGYNSPLWQHAQEVKALIDQLSDALNPDDEPEKRYGGRRAAIAAWTTKPGQPCTWARPGSFLLHAGIIPVRCQWGGVLDTATICAVDPKQPLWFSTHWQIPFTVQSIEPKVSGVGELLRELFRDMIQRSLAPPTFRSAAPRQLVALSASELEEVADWLADPANAWWAEELRKPPTEFVPLPVGIRPVQQRLFG